MSFHQNILLTKNLPGTFLSMSSGHIAKESSRYALIPSADRPTPVLAVHSIHANHVSFALTSSADLQTQIVTFGIRHFVITIRKLCLFWELQKRILCTEPSFPKDYSLAVFVISPEQKQSNLSAVQFVLRIVKYGRFVRTSPV